MLAAACHADCLSNVPLITLLLLARAQADMGQHCKACSKHRPVSWRSRSCMDMVYTDA